MKTLILQHAYYETPGTISTWLAEHNISTTVVRTWNGETVPERWVHSYDFLIMMGGPQSVTEPKKYPEIITSLKTVEMFFKSNKPVLGVCLGSQAIAQVLGARIGKSEFEFGFQEVEVLNTPDTQNIIAEYGRTIPVFQWHGENFSLPAGSTQLFRSNKVENQGFVFGKSLALQFHVEMGDALYDGWKTAVEKHHPDLAGSFPAKHEEHLVKMKGILFQLLNTWSKRINLL